MAGKPKYIVELETDLQMMKRSQDEIKEIITKHILPLYEKAVAILNDMVQGNLKANLYYWDNKYWDSE